MKTKFILCAFLSLGLLSFSSLTNNADDAYVGNWALVVEQTPEGDMYLIMTVALVDDAYTAKLVSDEGDIPLDAVSISDGKFAASFTYSEGEFELTGSFDKDEFKGEIYGMDMTFTTNGKRVVEE